jgi:ubiquinone/menaquinone biosynthesis C-methylase UbiE
MTLQENSDSDYLYKSYQQFEAFPYPNIPIDQSPKNNLKLLYESCFLTAAYKKNKQVITDLEQRYMLDVACGTGFTTLVMAIANPGAKIVGIDISPESLKLAEKRLEFYEISNVELHCLSLENIQRLDYKFDYINASDILYLLPDLSLALKYLKDVLKPNGILQGNLHSQYQRVDYYRAQTLFREMGLMNDNPEEMELTIVREFYSALKDNIDLKLRTWGVAQDQTVSNQKILMNHLFQNDKGYTLQQLFDSLKSANLMFIHMVDWRDWDWRSLFKDPDNVPFYLEMGLENSDLETQLRFYELIQPTKRLLEFWCCYPYDEQDCSQVDWREINPSEVTVHLHPCLKSEVFQQVFQDKDALTPINLGTYFNFLVKDTWIDRTLANILFVPLFEVPRSLEFFIERWLQVFPLNPATLKPWKQEAVIDIIKMAVTEQEKLGILMLDYF